MVKAVGNCSGWGFLQLWDPHEERSPCCSQAVEAKTSPTSLWEWAEEAQRPTALAQPGGCNSPQLTPLSHSPPLPDPAITAASSAASALSLS